MTIFAWTDGASRGNPGDSGIGVVMKDELGVPVFRGCGYIGKATNNIAEYRALQECLRKAVKIECKRLIVHSDSELMVRQMNGQYRVKDETLKGMYAEVQQILRSAQFQFSIVHVERGQNKEADVLANNGIDGKTDFPA